MRIRVCIAVAVVAAGLSACGSSSSGTSTSASNAAGSAGAGSAAVGSTDTASARYQARLNLAKCFRAHGINVPDPSPGAGPAGGGGLFRALRSYPQAQISSAQQACRQYFAQAFPRANLSPTQRAQFRAQIVKFAQCMRSHGINIPDPSPNASGGGFGFGQAFRSIDRNSPAFQAASQACASLRPRFGARGGGGAGAPGAGQSAPGGGASSD
ncbi:MAG: hypothetical protein JO153_16145 [Solirubrobacterales bacterium]|nr:hypothetical protein [Solirubrobacterales bacterium]